VIVLVAFVQMGASEDAGDTDISNGWGTRYSWVSGLEVAKEEAQAKHKPMMVILHRSWCGACKNLKSLFQDDAEVIGLSENFVMVNLGDKDEPNEAIYKPDGGYIPRVLFFHPDGSLLKDIINDEGNEKYKYYHFSTETIVSAMRQVLKLSESWSRIPSDEL